MKKYRILRIRQKISFSAFEKNMSVHELFFRAILTSYNELLSQNKIKCPWPAIEPEECIVYRIRNQ